MLGNRAECKFQKQEAKGLNAYKRLIVEVYVIDPTTSRYIIKRGNRGLLSGDCKVRR